MKNEDYVTKILEHVGPTIDVIGLFLLVKKIQKDEREACAKEVENALYGQEGCGKAAKAIRARGEA